MSISRRKIGFYALSLREKGSTTDYCDPYELRIILQYINDKDKKDRILDNKRSNKVDLLADLIEMKDIQNIAFGSAKYNHRPPLLDTNSGSERENPKNLDEGELERTHMAFGYRDDEVILILEERQAGISIGKLVSYIDRFAESIFEEHGQVKDYRIEYSIIPKDDFLYELDQMQRVVVGTIYTDKVLLGSEYLKFSERLESAKEDIEITVKAKRDCSIRDTLRDFYNKLISDGSEITKIRVHGTNSEKNKVTLDTDFIKKIEYVKADLDEITGLVDTKNIFRQFNAMLVDLIK